MCVTAEALGTAEDCRCTHCVGRSNAGFVWILRSTGSTLTPILTEVVAFSSSRKVKVNQRVPPSPPSPSSRYSGTEQSLAPSDVHTSRTGHLLPQVSQLDVPCFTQASSGSYCFCRVGVCPLSDLDVQLQIRQERWVGALTLLYSKHVSPVSSTNASPCMVPLIIIVPPLDGFLWPAAVYRKPSLSHARISHVTFVTPVEDLQVFLNLFQLPCERLAILVPLSPRVAHHGQCSSGSASLPNS